MKYFFLFITTYFLVNAQTDSIIINDFQDALRVGADYYTAPLKYDSKDWITFLLLLELPQLLSTLADKEIQKLLLRRHRSDLCGFMSLVVDKYYPPFAVVAARIVALLWMLVAG
ncbi:MAG: hypothetical protein MZV64_05485 [Ignavibacteriales bacterium]|nr:hypothetical protein [Ignavibacteriales bacterium]